MTLTFVNKAEVSLYLDRVLDTDHKPEYKQDLDGLPRITPARYGLPEGVTGSQEKPLSSASTNLATSTAFALRSPSRETL